MSSSSAVARSVTDPAPFVAFGRASLARYRELDALWGGAPGLRTTRWLRVFGPGAQVPVPLLDPAEVAELEPDVRVPAGGGALLVPDQGAVNPQRLAAVLAGHAGTVATGVPVTGVRTRGERIILVQTGIGDFEPGAVVLATGLVPPPWSYDVRQRWVKGHMLAVAPGPWRLDSVLASDLGGGAPLPGGGIVCGGTFDDDLTDELSPPALAGLRDGLHRLLPSAGVAPTTHRWYCRRPVVQDRHPVLDRLPGTVNGWVSAGHFTTGIMMAAGTGQALASWIGSGERPPGVASFGLPDQVSGR